MQDNNKLDRIAVMTFKKETTVDPYCMSPNFQQRSSMTLCFPSIETATTIEAPLPIDARTTYNVNVERGVRERDARAKWWG